MAHPLRPQGTMSEESLELVRATLRRHEGFDLGGYRPAYVARRVASRLLATHKSAAEYARDLGDDARERRLLVEALGLNVTSFFRDVDVWLFLEEVALPPLVDERRGSGKPFRALSLGCAGGQEAYSAAMLLSELVDGEFDSFSVDAWDVDSAALAEAEEAWYPATAVESLTKDTIDRYLERDGEGFRVEARLRSRVSVRRHDMLMQRVDREFDIIFLRNVLIYFDQPAKEAVLARVHDALAPRGLLVLGQSETISGRTAELFRPLSLRNRVYARVQS